MVFDAPYAVPELVPVAVAAANVVDVVAISGIVVLICENVALGIVALMALVARSADLEIIVPVQRRTYCM